MFGRLDLTENHVYTLSPALEGRSSRNLPDYLTVKAYISKDLPPELTVRQPLRPRPARRVPHLLEGQAALRGLRPGDDKKIEEEAGQCKVQKLQVQVMRSQKFEVGAYYLGLCFQYQGKDEAIPQVDAGRGARVPDLVAAQADDAEEAKVAFTNGHGERTEPGFSYLKHIEGVRGHHRQPVDGADSATTSTR